MTAFRALLIDRPESLSGPRIRPKWLVAASLSIGLLLGLTMIASAVPGQLDTSFGNLGKQLVSHVVAAEDSGAAFGLGIAPDGKIWQAGIQRASASDPFQLAIVTYDSVNGTPLPVSDPTSPIMLRAVPGGDAAVNDLTLDADGKALIAGTIWSPASSFPDLLLVRLDSNGDFDPTFGTGGIVESMPPTVLSTYGVGSASAQAVAMQSNKIIVVGSLAQSSPGAGIFIARYNSDGSLDASFGVDGTGLVVIDGEPGGTDIGQDVSVLPNGTILVLGFGHRSGQYDTVVARLLADGTFDTNFGGDGIVEHDLVGRNERMISMAIARDGGIVLAGQRDGDVAVPGEETNDVLVARLKADGSLDPSFNAGLGWLAFDALGGDDRDPQVEILPDGKIALTVIAPPSVAEGGALGTDYLLYVFHADGSPDTGFGVAGRARTDLSGSGSMDFLYAMAVQADGKILLGGTTFFNTTDTDHFGLARYQPPLLDRDADEVADADDNCPINSNADQIDSDSDGEGNACEVAPGALDPNFDSDGKQYVPHPAGTENGGSALGVGIAPDGTIWQAGIQRFAAGDPYQLSLVTYDALDGLPLPVSDLTSPVMLRAIPGGTAAVNDLIFDADGNVLLAGTLGSPATTFPDLLLVRLKSNGDFDQTFGTGGIVKSIPSSILWPYGAGSASPAVVAMQSNKIIIVGTLNQNSPAVGIFVARYNIDGSLDASFGDDGNGLVVMLADPGGAMFGEDVVVLPDGRLLVLGQSRLSGQYDAMVTRLEADGSFDATFGGGDGIALYDLSGRSDRMNSLDVAPDGSIVLTGHRLGAPGVPGEETDDILVARLDFDGTLDTSFNAGAGLLVFDALGGQDRDPQVAIRPDGKIVLTCISSGASNGYETDFLVYVFHANGLPDLGFGVNGRARTNFIPTGSVDLVYDMVIGADGKILLGGTLFDSATKGFALARYGAPLLDIDADGLGDFFESTFGGSTPASSVTVTNAETNNSATGNGSAGNGATVSSGSFAIELPAGTSVDSAATAIEIVLEIDETTLEARAEIKGADLAGGTKSLTLPFDNTASIPAVCIDDSETATIQTLLVGGDCSALLLPVPATVGAPAIHGAYTITRLSNAPPRVTISGLSNTALATIVRPDADGDGVEDALDNCVNDANAGQDDWDSDGQGDVCDSDDDNDGVLDVDDAFPFDASESADHDGDGLGDNTDLDDDNDGQRDVHELICGSDPLDAGSLSPDSDDDGVPDCLALEVTEVTSAIDPVQVGTLVSASATFIDEGEINGHTANIFWGDGTVSAGIVDQAANSVAGTHAYETPGVNTIRVVVTAGAGNSSEGTYQFVVIYDPDAGFVTGGGWINSPAGAYRPDTSLSGKANFGFVAKYEKNETIPTGNTEFHLKVADLNFHSDDYEWLTVTNHKAMYKGVGTINGSGNFGFMVSVIDAAETPSTDVDLFRIKIWDKDDGDAIVYDNQNSCPSQDNNADPCTAIGGGNIKVHKN